MAVCVPVSKNIPDVSYWWEKFSWYTGQGTDQKLKDIYDEMLYYNSVMAGVMSLWRDPPSPYEMEVHCEAVECMSERQKMALNHLESIIGEEKSW